MTGTSLKYLCAILNSSLVTWLVKNVARTTGMGLTEWTKVVVERFPIPKIPLSEQEPFIQLVERILAEKEAKPKADVSALEAEINHHIYELYELTPNEIKIIESI